ncbi:fungal-specific transcription factor domain-containing protein [Zopfochytrium polystomum]|nr:fungal-specific transcription factor domain-containing protein [Zopfochytrium polystomum]
MARAHSSSVAPGSSSLAATPSSSGGNPLKRPSDQLMEGGTASNGKSKRSRTVRACDPCRKKRIKCSGETPCVGCRSQPSACHYSPMVKKKAPTVRKNKFSILDKRLRSVESVLNVISPGCLAENWDGVIHFPKQVPDTEYSHGPAVIQMPANNAENQTPPQQYGNWNSNPAHTPVGAPSSAQPTATELKPPALSPMVETSPGPPPHSPVSTRPWNSPNLQEQRPLSLPSSMVGPSYEGGMLADPSGRYFIFFGATSAFGGSKKDQIYRSHPRWSTGVFSIPGTFPSIFRQRPRPALHRSLLLPYPPALINHLVDQYFQKFHPEFPMLDEPWFRNELGTLLSQNELEEEAHWPFILLILSIMTVTAQFTSSLSMWDGVDAEELSRDCLARSKKIWFERIEECHLFTAQALIILSMSAGGRKGKATATWTYVGMAVRKCQEIGLHRELRLVGIKHPALDSVRLEMHRRTWYCVMLAEFYVSLMSGRPLSIDSNDWDTRAPRAEDETVSNLLRHTELMGILGSISRFANRARPANREVFVTETEGRLRRWYESIDPSWKEGQMGPKWNVKYAMLLMYHSAWILFQKTAYGTIDDPICVESASSIVALLDNAPVTNPESDESEIIFPNFSYGVMMAVTVCLSKLIAPSDSFTPSKPPMPDAKQKLRRCLSVFDNLRSVSLTLHRFWRRISDFLELKGIQLDAAAVLDGADVAVTPVRSDFPDGPPKRERSGTPPRSPAPGAATSSLSSRLLQVPPRAGSDNGLPSSAPASPQSFDVNVIAGITDDSSADLAGLWDVNLFDLAGLGGFVDSWRVGGPGDPAWTATGASADLETTQQPVVLDVPLSPNSLDLLASVTNQQQQQQTPSRIQQQQRHLAPPQLAPPPLAQPLAPPYLGPQTDFTSLMNRQPPTHEQSQQHNRYPSLAPSPYGPPGQFPPFPQPQHQPYRTMSGNAPLAPFGYNQAPPQQYLPSANHSTPPPLLRPPPMHFPNRQSHIQPHPQQQPPNLQMPQGGGFLSSAGPPVQGMGVAQGSGPPSYGPLPPPPHIVVHRPE